MTYSTQDIQGRTFYINQPASGTKKAVIFCHGYGGNGASVATQLGNPDPSNYYLVFPSGVVIDEAEPLERQWRSGNTIGSVAEIGFFAEIIIHLKSLGVTEITIAGHSNGAIMSYLLMAKHPEYFKGAFCISHFLDAITMPIGSAAPIRHIHGVNDDVIPPFDDVNHDVETNMLKFIEAGHVDFETLILNKGHELQELNANNRIVIELEKFIGVA